MERDHVSQPYSTTGNIMCALVPTLIALGAFRPTGKITVLYILIFKFLGRSREVKSVQTEKQYEFPALIIHFISS
jgi:hypothetical protein